ncbi:MAG: type IV pilus assembly protein PilM [Planctomycetota bacterium]
MAKKNEAWGIEVGAQAIKAIKLHRSGSDVVVEDFDILPFKRILTTPDVNVEEEIRLGLDGLAQKHEIDRSQVVVSVPGHKAFARFAKLPPVDPSKVHQIVAYEAQQQIPFPIDQVEWDFQVFAEDDAPDVEVGIFAITKERVAQFLSNYRAVDVRVDALTLSPVAVYNAFAYEHADDGGNDGTVYLDIGTTSTDIIIVEAGGIWLRTLPLGGNHFTEALMKQFKISFSKAEKLKREASTSKYAKQIFQAMRGVFSDLVQEVQRSLGFYQSLNRDSELQTIVGVGSTWKLPGLQKYLKQHLQMDVTRPDGFQRISVEGKRASEFSASAVNLATAYGLALQGLAMETVSANILPQSIQIGRMWKAKQPWFATGAACFALAAGVAGVYHFVQSSSYDSSAEDKPQISRVINNANAIKQPLSELIAEDPRPEIDNYRRTFEYRDLWPKLTEDLAAALATVPTQEGLLDADPEAYAQIPRSTRRLVWVTGLRVEQYTAAPPVTAAVDPSTGEAATPAADPNNPLAATLVTFFPPPATGAPQAGPAMRLVITGNTPLPRLQAENLLKATLIKWYTANADQSDRPYRYRIDSGRALKTLSWRTDEPDYLERLASGSGNTPSASIGLGGTGPRPGESLQPGVSQPGSVFRPGGGLGQPAQPGGINEPRVQTTQITSPSGEELEFGPSGFTLAQLYPKRVTYTEDKAGEWSRDHEFQIEFDVVLLPPDQARRTMTPSSPSDEDPAAEPDTDNPAASDQTAQRDTQENRP